MRPAAALGNFIPPVFATQPTAARKTGVSGDKEGRKQGMEEGEMQNAKLRMQNLN